MPIWSDARCEIKGWGKFRYLPLNLSPFQDVLCKYTGQELPSGVYKHPKLKPMSHTIDLQQYFQRIGFTQAARPDLATLKQIQQLHTSAIPFENLNPFTGQPVRLELEAIEEKLIRQHRGGYCFEQNKLFKAVLEQIGFRVQGLAARVIFNQPIDAISPFSHMLLLIDLDGEPYISDVGFSGMSPTAPLKLALDSEQTTPHEAYRVVQQDLYYRLEARIKAEWKPLYKFHREAHFDKDYEVMNWYTSCHPGSHFTHTLIAARSVPGGRYALRNLQLSRHYLDRDSEQQEFKDPTEVLSALQDVFGIDISALPDLSRQIDQLFDE